MNNYTLRKKTDRSRKKLVKENVSSIPIFNLGPIKPNDSKLPSPSFSDSFDNFLDSHSSSVPLTYDDSFLDLPSNSIPSTNDDHFFENEMIDDLSDNSNFMDTDPISVSNYSEFIDNDSTENDPELFDFGDEIEEPQSFNLEDNKVNKFCDGLLKIIAANPDVKYSVYSQVLNLVKDSFNVPVPVSYKTIVNQALKNSPSYSYYIRCDCYEIFSFSKDLVSSNNGTVECPHCNSRIIFKEHIAKSPHVCSFSIREQLSKISQVFSDLSDLPSSIDEEFIVRVSFSLDGEPLSDDTKNSLTPVNLYICNIKDNNIKNKLVIHKSLVIFKDHHTEDSDLALAPFIEEIKQLSGTYFKTAWSNKTKLVIDCFMADAVCRHDVLQVSSHSGNYFCFRCLATISIRNKNKKIIPLLKSTDEINYRTKGQMNDCLEILQKQIDSHRARGLKDSTAPDSYEGFKGVSCLFEIPNFDPFLDTIVEPMHCFFLGITKRFVQHLYDVPKSSYYLTPSSNPLLNKKLKADNRLLNLKAPSSIPRYIRSLKYWPRYSATEFRYFLFYYAFFTLKDILQPVHFSHFMLFSSAVFKLYSRNCSNFDIESAIKEIDQFLDGLTDDCLKEEDQLVTYNPHILVHSSDDRKRHGPLADISADGYENELRLYKKGVNSHNIRVETIAQKVLLKMKLNLYALTENKGVKFFPNNKVDKNLMHQNYISFINSKLNLVENSGISFFKEAKNDSYRFRSILFFTNDHNDSFIRIEDNFYVILVLCRFGSESYALCKKMKVLDDVELRFKNFHFKMKQIKVVDDSFEIDQLRSPPILDSNYELIDLKFLKCHCLYVEQKERISEFRCDLVLKKYIVDIEH